MIDVLTSNHLKSTSTTTMFYCLISDHRCRSFKVDNYDANYDDDDSESNLSKA